MRYMANNQFSTAAKMYKEMAELEEEEKQMEAASEFYNKAADCYVAEGSNAYVYRHRACLCGPIL